MNDLPRPLASFTITEDFTPSAGPDQPVASDFTPRERQTLALIAAGHSNKIIGVMLDVSFNTAKFHVRNLMRKLGADNRAAAAAAAVRMGLA